MNQVYSIITNRIIKELKQGKIPWQQTWTTERPINHVSQRPYHGINVLLLSMQGYKCNQWLTFRQCKQKGGTIKKGERGTMVVFWKPYTIEKEVEKKNEEGEIETVTEEKKIRVLRYYKVFNLQQTTLPVPEHTNHEGNTIQGAEEIVKTYQDKPQIQINPTVNPSYAPNSDIVHIPPQDKFDTPESYYSTLFHELTHSTGHEKRLNRLNVQNLNFGSDVYSKEELVAEIGACFLCNECGIERKTEKNTVAYVQSWIEKLQNNVKWIIQAASKAEKAVQHIKGK